MSLINTIIKVNGKYYAGETDLTYKSYSKSNGWINYHDGEYEFLLFTKYEKEAKIIEGNINLKSILDKILNRVRDKMIDLESIEIIKVGEE